jgi:hypothetical protein
MEDPTKNLRKKEKALLSISAYNETLLNSSKKQDATILIQLISSNDNITQCAFVVS